MVCIVLFNPSDTALVIRMPAGVGQMRGTGYIALFQDINDPVLIRQGQSAARFSPGGDEPASPRGYDIVYGANEHGYRSRTDRY
jgi:hypothetical protein